MKMKSLFLGCLASLLSQTVHAQIDLEVYMKERGAKTDSLHYGIFFEDINHAADGGLYAGWCVTVLSRIATAFRSTGV